MKGTCSKDESRNSTDSERSAETRFTANPSRNTALEEATSSPREPSTSYKRHRHIVLGRIASKKARSHPSLQDPLLQDGHIEGIDLEDEHSSFLDDVIQQLSRDHLELSAHDALHLERSARNALRITLGWVEQNLKHPSPCAPEPVALQLLHNRLLLLRESFDDDKLLDAAQLLTALFLLVVRGAVFRDVPLEPWDVVDLSGVRPRVNSLPRLRATLLHYLSPLCSCVLPHLLMTLPNTLYLCQQLIQDLCPPAHSEAATQDAGAGRYSIRIPSGVQAMVLDLDDTVFLHQQVRQLREVYWVLAQARGTVRGIDAELLKDVVMPAVPNRDFLLRLVDSMHASGGAVYVASFGLNEWVRPVVDLVFGDRIPQERVYSLDGHPPRHPVVLNKNLWLADVMERHGVSPRHIVLVDDQISNVARALAGGFSALQVPASRGLDAAVWQRALGNATADHFLQDPPPRTHAYCPADGAVFDEMPDCREVDQDAYELLTTQKAAAAPGTPAGTSPGRAPVTQRTPGKQANEVTMAEGCAAQDDSRDAPGCVEVPMQAAPQPTASVGDAEMADGEETAPGPRTPAPASSAFTPASLKERRSVSHGDLLTARHRFILKHKEFEAVRSLTTPPRPMSRHARARPPMEGSPRTPPQAGKAPRPPLYQGPRSSLRTLDRPVNPVALRQVPAGPWLTGNPGLAGHETAAPVVQSAMQCPGLCAQMAKLGMATEA